MLTNLRPGGATELSPALRRLRERRILLPQLLKGVSDFEGFTVSLKRYPDTKPEFFRKLFSAVKMGKK
jgi:hypothetical protein